MLRSISLLITLISVLPSFAQLNADFTANVTSGCEPLVVNFTDLSTGSGITSREWIFGYGGNISNNNNPNPSAAYPAPGTFTVKLIISNGTTIDSIVKTNYITVHAKPTPSFTFSPNSGCAPLLVNFTNSSSAGSGSISSYQWDFGDGSGFSAQANPSHTYISGGTYPPTLKVTNSFGCHKTSGQGAVNVSSGPTAAFTSSTSQACNPPLTVTYTNQSTGIGPMNYAWDLGVSNSSAQNPSATYTSAGFYDVALTVTDAYGCKDTIIENDYVAITAVQAAFDLNDSVCAGQNIGLQNNTVGASSFQWQWGDGSTGFGSNPNKVYNNGGTYVITLTAVSGTCSDTYTKTVHVQKVTADFSTSSHYGCEVPHVVNYADQSTVNMGQIDSWYWKLGNRGAVNGPYYAMFGYDSVISIARGFHGVYSDTLRVWSTLGCTDEEIKVHNVLIEDMIPSFSANPSSGCAPQQVAFTDNSTPTPSYPITGYWWDLGNGDTSIAQNPIVNYTDTGCYNITQVIVNSYGCTDTAFYTVGNGLALCYGAQQQAGADLSLTPDTVCAGMQVVFYDTSFDQQYITDYLWNFDDDTIRPSGVITEETFASYSFMDTGWISLQYVVGQHGCWDTTYYDSSIYVNGPVLQFSVLYECDSPLVRTFESTLFGHTRFYWDFGDGSPLDSVNLSPSHTYSQGGDYWVFLEAFNDSAGCSMIDSFPVYVRDLSAQFGIDNNGSSPIDSTGCAPVTFFFEEDCQDHENFYEWYVDGMFLPNSNVGTISRQFTTSGVRSIKLRVWDVNGCVDSLSKNVYVSKPKADFDFAISPGCDPVEVTFNDSSSSDTNIVSWQWFLGDASGYHYEQNPVHTYSDPGNYQIRLIVTDSFGCSDLEIQYLPISFPFPGFYVDSTLCQFTPVHIQNTSNGTGLQFNWNFDNGTTSQLEDPMTFYVDTGYFDIRLALVDSQGCLDTVIHRVHVQNKPVPDIYADTLFSPCLPLPVAFIDSTRSTYVESWKWTFGDGSASVKLDTNVAFHNYITPGIFDVSLELTTTYGCKGNQNKPQYIEVNGPYADFGVAPDSACKGDRIAFFVEESSRMAMYRWVFGDGEDTVVNGSVDTVYHHYTDTVGWRTPVVVYYDSSEACEIPIVDSVYIHAVYARYAFFPDSIGCGNLNTRLINKSLGDDSYHWDFGDGRTSNKQSPSIYYPSPGLFPVKLYVKNAAIGCEDSMVIPFVVFPLPEVNAFGDTLICLYDSTMIEAESNMEPLTWSWSPAQGLAMPSERRSFVSPDTTRYYVASAVDSNGCIGRDSVRIVVQDPPDLDLIVDTTVIIGEEFKLNPSTPDSLLYLWRPPHAFDCDTCKNPWFKAEESDWYSVVVRDIYGCFEETYKFKVDVIEKYSVDVPELFSPNGDGLNDAIFVRGWGIEALEEFAIYNRWGQEIFSTNDLKQGWDGTFNGAEQQMDTYAYIVKVKFYDDNQHVLHGFIELIR
ncbi:MAG: PKD domain-containing protein [Cryomorphaceae bacterium]